jgi:hypothetical protein
MYFNAKQAEETCKSVSQFSWSQMLASAGLSVQLANKEMRQLLQGNAPKVPQALRQSAIAQVKDNQNKCYEVLHTIQERSKDIRETDMELRITEAAAKQNMTKEAILKQMLKREPEADILPLLSIHVGGKTRNQLDKVWTPVSNGPQDIDNTTWKSHVEVEAIWEALITHGKEHFSQASDTPFASGPIAEHLGPHEWNEVSPSDTPFASGPIAEHLGPHEWKEVSQQILEGTFDIDSITDDLDVQDVIKAMSHHDPTNPTNSNSCLTIEKLKEGFSYVKESTSSNPEGLHHGHWKSLIQDDAVFKPFVLMIMFAFRWGEPPNVWSNSLQICLPKDDPNTPTKIT